MKKSILTMLVFLVCVIQTTTAYEYFTIYFSDGTKSEAFYATDIDSICYSKIGLDSIAYDNWQVQEIYTCDSVYRYPLAKIDSLSFKDMDVDKVAESIAQVSAFVNPLYLQCNSSLELSQNLSSIINMDGVEKVWSDSQSLFIKIRDYGVLSYSYPPHNVSNISLKRSNVPRKRVSGQLPKNSESIPHKHIDVKNVCVIRQMTKDKKHEEGIAESDIIIQLCRQWGLNVIVNDNLQPDFFTDEIKQYDLVFLMTHGLYNGSHWLATNEEIYTQTLDKTVNVDSLHKVAKQFITTKYYNHGYSLKDVSFSPLIENRNGVKTLVCYTWISNHFISKHRTPQSSNVIVFNSACQSMKDNPELANAFINAGAICYTGFTESNMIGPWTNRELCERLLGGFSIFSAYQTLPDIYYQETVEEPEGSGNYVYPILILWPEKEQEEVTSICITHPETLSAEIGINDTEVTVELKGSIKTLDPGTILVEEGEYGFHISKTPDFAEYDVVNTDKLGYVDHNKDSQVFTYKTINIANQLTSNTTYYYRAYINDGYSNCYGEIKSFTTKGNAEAYYVWNAADNTAIYYYDGMRESRGGRTISNNHSIPIYVVNVIFDISFSNYYPHRFKFNTKLRRIENISYLKTDSIDSMAGMFNGCSSLTSLDLSSFNTSNVTNMNCMFQDCSSLTNLDLSSFNTSNVTNMNCMFQDCSSLTNLDLSSFNTSNVTRMGHMFSYCSSLTSLDLSSFDTSNVTYMHSMFGACSSLTSLDLSSFNTSNVTNMEDMFSGCSSLTSLDLSSFNTSNVTDMDVMFRGCSSLTSLDLSSFNTSNVTDMWWMFNGCSSLTTIFAGNWISISTRGSGMFLGCNNLVGGKGTKIGQNLYGYDNKGKPLYYNCPTSSSAAHIDGGKENPGLFTAK